ncbi:MerR family transcriptional regulator [Pontibacter litorisediminis]|uniref:MerR family transcriptional regulator n=1 Tax=Pontibacter litorisediminis TaxID=1846260 RepID=UPI0023EC3882|nr:MerR family transcriptional regulator [Pontibacter litorisediminis]
MAQYTIKELEHLSGIKAHTIRIWEQRYGILNPKRTETNIRYYDDADLKSLLNISLLNERGYKISKIAQMDKEQILETVQQLCDQPCAGAQLVSELVSAMVDMDEYKFERVVSKAALQLGFQETMQEVIYPFLNKIGILWQTGNITPAHEHFVSNLIRQKLLVAIDGQNARWKEEDPVYVLYLPEGELHELALLYMNYILRAYNQRVVYLGQHLPFKDLELTYEQFKARYLCTVLTSVPEREQVQAYLNKLSRRFPDCTIYVYGYQVQHDFLVLPENVERLSCMKELIAKLK